MREKLSFTMTSPNGIGLKLELFEGCELLEVGEVGKFWASAASGMTSSPIAANRPKTFPHRLSLPLLLLDTSLLSSPSAFVLSTHSVIPLLSASPPAD